MYLHFFGLVCTKSLLATNLFMSPSLQGQLTVFLAFKDVFAGGTRALVFSKPTLNPHPSLQTGHYGCESF